MSSHSSCQRRPSTPLALLLCVLALTGMARAGTNLSSWVFPAANGRILCQPDALGNRILDYSMVGYKGGTVPIPEVAVKTNVVPGAGDDTAKIQGAINYVKTLPVDANGFRGAVLLSAGEYQISNALTIDASGIVLRGVDDGSDTNTSTILRAVGARTNASVSGDHAPLIIISGSGSASTSGTARNITNNYVPVGARSFNVDSTSGLTIGSRVRIVRPSPTNWIHDIGMDLVSPAWTPGSFNVPSERFITRIDGNRITLDAPLTCALEAQYGGGTIQTYSWSGRITNVGVEDIRGISDFDSTVVTNTGASSNYFADELHALCFIEVDTAENIWIRRSTSQYFGYGCVHLKTGTRAATVRDCNSLDPVSIITGSRRYAFALSDAQLCLVQNCYTRNDRHQFVTDSLDTGPNVFVDGLSDIAWSDAGPHFRWGTGTIWDNVTVNGDNIDVQNRGNLGTSHGWAGANEVIWNSKADGFVVQGPPTARNWLIGSVGTIQNGTVYVGPHDNGTYDAHGTNVFPNSLYYMQLQDRLAAPNLQTREIWLGDIDQFTTASPTGEVVTVNPAWFAAVQSAAGAGKVSGFDLIETNHWVPFTFSNSLAANERIVAASLAVALRAPSPGVSNGALYLNTTSSSNSFASLGWLPIATGTNTTVRVFDLAGQLNSMSSGVLNVAIQGDIGIDWAMLEYQVTTNLVSFTNTLPPVADAYVRAGIYSNANFGSETTLAVKLDNSADVRRQAYLRWDLTGVTNQILSARVRLTPVGVGTNGLQQGITLATSNNWSESSLTWSNQSGGGKRFATWIPTANVPVEFVVTPQAQSVANSDRRLALELFSLSNVGGAGTVSYASREDTTPALRPQLLLTLAGNLANTAPTISTISNRTIGVNVASAPIPFSIQDAETAPQNLSLSVTSSNTSLVPVSSVVFSDGSSNCAVTITPATGQTGSSLLAVTVTDSGGLSSSSAFTLTVAPPPPLTNVGQWDGGSFTLSSSGPENSAFRILATTNLALPTSNWTALATGLFSGGVFNYTDVLATNFPSRFYQTVSP